MAPESTWLILGATLALMTAKPVARKAGNTPSGMWLFQTPSPWWKRWEPGLWSLYPFHPRNRLKIVKIDKDGFHSDSKVFLEHDESLKSCHNSTLQSMMNAKFSPHRFWPCLGNRLIKTILMIPHNFICEFQVDFPLLWIKNYPGLS